MRDECVERITLSPTVRVRIEYDHDAEPPTENNVGEIAYLQHRREITGTEAVSDERMEEIKQGIEDGTLIGLPVNSYSHGGTSISLGGWGSPSGYIYCTPEKALEECGDEQDMEVWRNEQRLHPGTPVALPEHVKEATLLCFKGEVETYDQYLQGDVYGYVVEHVELDEDGDEVDVTDGDSCWGFFGLDYARECAREAGEYAVKADNEEATERAAWEARDVITTTEVRA